MKSVTLIVLLFSFNTFAETCLSHGSCAVEPVIGQGCYIIDDGYDQNGTQMCHKQCFAIKVTRYCDFIPDRNFGVCKWEKLPNPKFNPNASPVDGSMAGDYPELK